MAKRNLTDRALQALKPAEPGKRYDLMDLVTPGMGVRVSDNGTKVFVLATRYPGSTNPTRRALGEYGLHMLGHVRRMFNWAIARGVYGIDRSPCDRMKPTQVIGPEGPPRPHPG